MAQPIVYKKSNAKNPCEVCGDKIPEERVAAAKAFGIKPKFCSDKHKDVQHQRDLRAARSKAKKQAARR